MCQRVAFESGWTVDVSEIRGVISELYFHTSFVCSQLPYPKEDLPPWSSNSLRALFIPFDEPIVMKGGRSGLQCFFRQRILRRVKHNQVTGTLERFAGEAHLLIDIVVPQRTCCLNGLGCKPRMRGKGLEQGWQLNIRPEWVFDPSTSDRAELLGELGGCLDSSHACTSSWAWVLRQ